MTYLFVSYNLHPVDDTILGDPRLTKEMGAFTAESRASCSHRAA